jgi:hypothetical protein
MWACDRFFVKPGTHSVREKRREEKRREEKRREEKRREESERHYI